MPFVRASPAGEDASACFPKVTSTARRRISPVFRAWSSESHNSIVQQNKCRMGMCLITVGEMSLKTRYFKSDMKFFSSAAIAVLIVTGSLAGCASTGEVLNNGYIVDEQSLALVPVGASREQVLLSLGSPSTTATFDGEVFYYISQKRTRPVAFMKPKLVDQSILAIYFDKDGVVTQRSNYTNQDGKVFDMISRTTPTGGKDLTFLQQLLSGGGAGLAKSMIGNTTQTN